MGSVDRRREPQCQTGLAFAVTELGKVLKTSEQLFPHLEAPIGTQCFRQTGLGRSEASASDIDLPEPPLRVMPPRASLLIAGE